MSRLSRWNSACRHGARSAVRHWTLTHYTMLLPLVLSTRTLSARTVEKSLRKLSSRSSWVVKSKTLSTSSTKKGRITIPTLGQPKLVRRTKKTRSTVASLQRNTQISTAPSTRIRALHHTSATIRSKSSSSALKKCISICKHSFSIKSSM